MQGRNHTAWKQNPTITIMFHESIAILLKNAPFFEVPLSHEMWFSRTLILVQYWRSLDSLLAYAKSRNAEHLPAWQSFNQAIGTDGSVGIWHETYVAKPGTYENIYANMPPFGLGKAGTLVEAKAGLQSASGRIATTLPP
jgi:hypothetical protein